LSYKIKFDCVYIWTFYAPFMCWLICEHILWWVNFPINFELWCYVCVFWSGLAWSGLMWWSCEPMFFNLFWSGPTWYGLMWFNFPNCRCLTFMLQMEVISNPFLSMSIFVFSHLCYGFVICGVLGCDTKGSKLDLQNTWHYSNCWANIKLE
jgi:hypothetical protein